MTIKLIIPGQREAAVLREAARGASAGGVPVQTVTNLLDAVEVVDAFNLSAPARDRAGAERQTFEARDDDILEIEVEGGFTLWTSAKRYSQDVALLKPEAMQDGSVDVGTLPRGSVTERGVKEWFQSGLSILRLRDDAISHIPADLSKLPSEFLQDSGWIGSRGRPRGSHRSS